MLNVKKPATILLLFSIILIIFGLGFNLGKSYNQNKFSSKISNFKGQAQENKPKNLDFTLFWSVWDTLDKKFVTKNKLDPQLMYYGAIKGMVATLNDPYTFFLTPEENKQSKNDLSGLFEGIGAQLGMKNGRIVIVAPLKKSPAERAGIQSGDIILKVNAENVAQWTLQKAVSKIRGKKGTTVTLTILRNSIEKKFSIVRDSIKVPSTEYKIKKNVGVLTLNRFGEDTNDEWDNQVEKIQQDIEAKKIKAMVLDVRDNPGGYLQGAIYIASEFLPLNKIVVKQEYKDERLGEIFKVERQGKLQSIPVVVLINNGSASASEIVAGALRDHKRATLIGQKSFGKGSIQEAIDLDQNAGLHVTIARWVLPNGDWINGKGIKPDIEVINDKPVGDNTPDPDADKQLDKAIKTVLE